MELAATSELHNPQPGPYAPLISMPEIAALAQVKRPVVSTWRRRYPDFPAPLAGSADRLLFHGGAVTDWLLSSGLGNADPSELRAELALHAIAAHANQFGARRLVELLGSLLCLRYLDDRPLLPSGADDASFDVVAAWSALRRRAERMDAEDQFVLREIQTADSRAIVLARLAEDLIEAAYSPGGAYEWLLSSRRRLGLAELTSRALTSELLHLLADLSDVSARVERDGSVTLADPHAGSGDLLVALADKTDDSAELQALAAEPQSWLARLTRRRLLLRGFPEYSLDVQIGAELEEGIADPDIIVTQLPYQAAEERSKLSALEEVERVSDLLGPGSTALVVGPAAALVDALQDVDEAKLRGSLLRRGVVEAVITLPGGVTPYRPGYRSALWILTRDPILAARGYVLLADLGAEALDERVRTELSEDVLLWRTEGRRKDGHDPRFGCVEPIARLDAAFGSALTPPRPPVSEVLARTVDERPALIVEAERRLERAAERAQRYVATHGPLRGQVVRREGARPRRTTVGTLIAEKTVIKLKGHRIDPRYILPTGHHDVLGPEEVCGSSPVGGRRIDRLTLAAEYEHAALTEPGDVVYTTAPRLGLAVDHNGFSVALFPARVLRINSDAESLMTPRVLAALLAAAKNTERSPSAVRAVRRIEDFMIPDLDTADVERFDALLADVDRRQALLREQNTALEEARRLTLAGFADGSLTIDHD
ncbi:hypothetical protein [Kitasatospora sp. MAP5-34]|uniref:hypothetical protein n=1 Tax=Kitasatospora sp. MAP5-34 TaxID=3035102 RepID=UPI00247579C6|nr:hypothetical protein [Kitasatospora sp. MAP5-34]MDH6578852.1 hypothetical protein [Kitasatospora sp. MAP5-34]